MIPEGTNRRVKHPWWIRLDDWQHRHSPPGDRHPHLAVGWDWMWKPLCNKVDRYWGVKQP